MNSAEVLRALATILEYCLKQNRCKDCIMREFCKKMPCEW